MFDPTNPLSVQYGELAPDVLLADTAQVAGFAVHLAWTVGR